MSEKHSTKRLRVVFYSRMSSDEQTLSIPQQENWRENTARARDLEVAARFDDPGISGNNPNRPGFLRMIEYCEREAKAGRPVDAVLCWDPERFSRMGLPKTMKFVDRLIEAGCTRMLTDEKDIDFTNDTDLLVFAIEQQASRHAYVKKVSANTLRGLLDNYEAGGQNGGTTPYACVRVVLDAKGEVVQTLRRGERFLKPKGGKIVRVPDYESLEAQVVKEVFRRIDQGDTSRRGLAIELNERGISSPGGAKWDSNSITMILENPIYAGGYRWGLRSSGEHKKVVGGKAVQQPPGGKRTPKGKRKVEINEDVEIRWGACPPLVQQEVWERINKSLKQQKQEGSKPRANVYPLSGMVFCAHCKGKMFGHMSRGSGRNDNGQIYEYPCYICSTSKRSGTSVCEAFSIREDQLLPFLLRCLQEEYLKPERLAGLRAALLERIRERHQSNPDEVKRLRNLIAECERDLKRGRTKLLREENPEIEAQLRQAMEETLARQKRYERELANAEQQEGVPIEEEEQQVEAALARLRDLGKQLQETKDPAKLRAVLRLMVSRIELSFETPPNRKARQRHSFRKGVIKLRPGLAFDPNALNEPLLSALGSDIHFTAADLAA